MRQRVAAAIGLLLAGTAMAQLPGYTHIDLPYRYGPPTNLSEEYVLIDAVTTAADMSGQPGIYRHADINAGNAAPVVPLTYLNVDNGSVSGAVYGVIPLANGDNVVPVQISGQAIYGLVVTATGFESGMYRCDLATVASSPDTSCLAMSDYQLPLGVTARASTVSGYTVARNTATDIYSVFAPLDHAAPGAELFTFSATGRLLTDFRGASGSRRGVGLFGGNQSGLRLTNAGLLVMDQDQAVPFFVAGFPEFGAIPPDGGDFRTVPVSVSPLDVPWLPANTVRVLFQHHAVDSTVTPADLWIADYTIDFAAQTLSFVSGSALKITGATDELRSHREWTYSARLTEQGVVVAIAGSDTVAGQQEAVLIDTTAAVVVDGAAIQRLDNLFPEAVSSANHVLVSVNDCGTVYYTSYDDGVEPTTFDTGVIVSDACPGGLPAGNQLTVAGPQAVIDPAVTSMLSIPLNIYSVSVHGIDVSCSTDPALLTLTGGVVSSFYPADALVVGPTQTGNTWQVALAPQGTDQPVTGSGELAVLDFSVPYVTGTADILCTVEASDGNGQAVDVAVVNASVSIDDGIHGGSGSISGQVLLPVGTDHSGIEVTIYRNGHSYMTTTDTNGNYLFTGLRDATFSLTFSSDRYVSDCVQAVVTGGAAVSLPSRTMTPGDINNDDLIDIGDFTILANAYGTSTGDSGFVPEADLNTDGTISIRDLSIMGSHFGLNMCSPENLISACGFDTLGSGALVDGVGTELTLDGMSATVTTIDDVTAPSLEAFVADIASPVTGSTYIEYTYNTATALDNNSFGVFGFLNAASSTSNGIGVGVYPGTGSVVAMDGTVLFSGLSIAPGYTVGATFNHTTGQVLVQDSLGNSTSIQAPVELIGIPLYAGIGGQPAAGAGNSLTGTLSVNDGSYVLTPFAGSSDWCGQPL